jgi:hypothetical protein
MEIEKNMDLYHYCNRASFYSGLPLPHCENMKPNIAFRQLSDVQRFKIS